MEKNEKNAVDDFLAGLDNEPKDDPFKPESSDPFKTEVMEEKKEEVEKEEKPLPFNKDPKVQRFIEKEINKRLADIKPTETEKFVRETSQDSDELMDSLTEIIGNDTPAKITAAKKFRQALGDLEEKGAQKALQQIQQQAEQERQEVVEAQETLIEGFENIEETYGVDLLSPKGQNLRTEFVNFITRVAPKDSEGNVTEYPDIEETFKLFKDMKKPDQNNRAKELASRSIGRSNDASLAPVTGNSWKDVDRILSKLSN